MENYICINGKKAELTEEQLKALGIELPKTNPFYRAALDNTYYAIDTAGVVRKCSERGDGVDDAFYKIANYCTDKAIMEQRALHETLNRLLWRYSMEHDGDKLDWVVASKNKYYIYYSYQDHKYCVNYLNTYKDIVQVYFYNYDIAENAIKEIIEPFIEAHPEFKW